MVDEKHECVIGITWHYEDSQLMTLNDLKEHIKSHYYFDKQWQPYHGKYKLSDYGDRRKSTDLERFDFCPFCGKKIDWKAIKSMDDC